MDNRIVKRNARSMLAFLASTASALALAGPPFLTDDPEPVEYQHHELYIGTQQTKTADGRTGNLPHVEYNSTAQRLTCSSTSSFPTPSTIR
jgi:hypothetical protein